MRFGKWRGVALAFALVATITVGPARSVRAGRLHTIPREVEAVDLNTGGPFFAPPVPYGHYAKGGTAAWPRWADCSTAAYSTADCCTVGCGATASAAAGTVMIAAEPAVVATSMACSTMAAAAAAMVSVGVAASVATPAAPRAAGLGNGGGFGLCKRGHGGKFFGTDDCGGLVTTSSPIVTASSQSPLVSPQSTFTVSQCGDSGCKLKLRHFHRRGRGCDQCSGNGCGICQGGSRRIVER